MADLSGGIANTVTVSSGDGLAAALASAHAGETILLAAGAYGQVSLSGLHFNGAVTIQSADAANPAVLASLHLDNTSGLAFNHLDVSLPGDTTAVAVLNSSNVTFSGMTVHGAGVGEGFLVRDSSNVSIDGSDFRHIGSGIAHVNDDGVTFSNNVFYDLQTDGIFGGGSAHVVVEGNQFSDFHPQPGDHPDAIQFWGGVNGAPGTDITIRDNVITRGGGEVMQGIFIENSDRVVIAENAMSGTMFNGISLSTTSNAVVEDNFVQGFTDMESWIIVRGESANVTVSDNVAQAVINYKENGAPNPNYVESGTTIIPAAAPVDHAALTNWLASHVTSTLPDNPLSPPPVVGGFVPPVPTTVTLDAMIAHEIATQLSSLSISNIGWAMP